MKKIGLFGGTFDPWTKAHQAIVDGVLESKLVDMVIILPTIVDYHRNGKDKWLSDTDKFKVLYKFIESSKNQGNIFMDFAEIRKKNSGQLSEEEIKNWRFINTLERVENLFRESPSLKDSELFTIIGTDSLRNFKTWHRWEDILKKSKLIAVCGRDGEVVDTDIEYIPMNIPAELSSTSSTEIRNKFKTLGVDAYIDSVFGE